MSAPNPQILAVGGGSPLSVPVDLGRPSAGLPGDAVLFEIWNAKGDTTADAATGLAIRILSGPRGGTLSADDRAASEGWVQIRTTGIVGGTDLEPQSGAWRAVSTLQPFELGDIPADRGRQMEIRLNPPASADTTVDLDFEIALDFGNPASAASPGLVEGGIRGVWSGIGDPLASFIVRGGELAAHGTLDSGFAIAEVQWLLAGEPHAAIAQSVTLNGDAADGALGSGQAYVATISLDASGVVVTKSNKVAAPPQVGDRLPAPDGQVLLGFVVRDTMATISSGDVDGAGAARGRFALTGSSLQRTLSGGRAVVDGAVARPTGRTLLTLPPSESNARIWMTGSGSPAVTATGVEPPEPRAVLLYSLATNTTDVTSLSDERRTLGRHDRLTFRFDGVLAPAQAVIATWTGDRDARIRVPASVAVALFDAGTTATAGATEFEIELWNGSAWVSLFPSSGMIDRRPSVAFNGALFNTDALPETLLIPSGTRLRCTVTTIPTAVAAPSGAEVALLLEVP